MYSWVGLDEYMDRGWYTDGRVYFLNLN